MAEELQTRAGEVLALTKRIEELAAGTGARYEGMRARVEAGATLRQARELLRAMGELGGRVRGPAPRHAEPEGEPEERRLEREFDERRERLAEMRRWDLERDLRRRDDDHDMER